MRAEVRRHRLRNKIVDNKYAVSNDAKFELLHGRARDRTGDDMEEHEVADGVYLTRKRKANLQIDAGGAVS